MSRRWLHGVSVLVALLVVGDLFSSVLPVAAKDKLASSVVAIAHRGGIVPGYPENTLAAFREAIRHGADVIELDLRGTKDGEAVVIHDETLDRTTNGRGRVSQYGLAELKKLDAGYGERIPTYEEALQLVAGTGVKLLLDVKENSTLDKGAILRLTDKHRAMSAVIVGVSNLEDHRAFREFVPNLRTLAFIGSPDDIDQFLQAGADIIRLWPKWIYEKPDLVNRIHRSNRSVWTTADDAPRAELMKLIGLGVDGILSDYPQVMKSVLAELKKTRRP